MAAAKLLPLFPLEVVLFPGTILPLHVFEPRYRLMVGEAVDKKSEFGVILVNEGKLADAGCTAFVQKVTQRFEDGRFDVETLGWRRFLPLSLDDSLSYIQADVEYFEDEDRAVPDPAKVQKILQLAQQVAEQIGVTIPATDSARSPASFRVAAALPLDLSFKQSLLATRSETDRLRDLEPQLVTVAGRIAKARLAQALARTNGRPQ